MELSRPRRLCLDTSAAIYLLDRPASDPRRRVVEPFVRGAERGELTLVASTVVVTELLVKPLRDGNRPGEIAVRLLLELCHVVSVTRTVAEQAAVLRARYGLRTPDALICATAVVDGCDAVLGNDQRWQRVREIELLLIG